MKSFLVALFLVVSLGSMAQSGVVMDEKAQMAINGHRSRGNIAGYRVCVFSDNSQSARGAASAAMGQLESGFNLSANVVYQNPFFKVYAGYCINRLEASMLLGRLKSTFPSAFIVREQIPLTSLQRGVSDKTEQLVDDNLEQ